MSTTVFVAKDVFFLLIQLFCLFGVSVSLLPVRKHAPQKDGSLRLLVVGDWGRKGTYNQSEIAFQMGRIGEELAVDFMISTGDNFYDNGLTGIDDPAFQQSFSQIYTSQSLQKPWYNFLGNHDYRGDVLAQLDPVLNGIDDRWICMRSFVLNTGVADFFMVDTTPFVRDYWLMPNKHTYDWRGVLPKGNYIRNVLKDLDSALRQSTARWKIVAGHHPIRSVSHHGDTVELQRLLLPILVFFTSGGGSKAWRGIDETANMDGLKFYYDGQGFMSLQINESVANVSLYDINGTEIHTWSKSKQLHPAA